MKKIHEIKNKDQLNICASLYKDVFNSEPWNDNWTEAAALDRLNDFFDTPGFIGLCAFENEKLTGCIIGNIEKYFEGNYFYLKEMFVSRNCQRRGIGKELITELEAKLNDRGIKNIILFTSNNMFPAEFYAKNGFTVLGNMCMMKKKI